MLIFLLSGHSALSQILNVEKIRLESDTVVRFGVDAGLSFNIYNRTARADEPVRSLSFKTNLDLTLSSPKHAYLLLNSLRYLSINESPFISTAYSHFRANFFKENTLSYELFAQYQYDLQRFLDHRYLVGSGMRLRFIEGDVFTVWAGVGAMYEIEEWDNPLEEGVVIRRMLKNTNYLSTKMHITDWVSFTTIVYFQWGYDGIDEELRSRIHTDNVLEFEILENFSFTTTFQGSYDTNPVIPVTNFIYNLNNGFTLKF